VGWTAGYDALDGVRDVREGWGWGRTPSIHDAKYLVELGSILPKGPSRRTGEGGGLSVEVAMVKEASVRWKVRESSACELRATALEEDKRRSSLAK
jgi:hypothetical protein